MPFAEEINVIEEVAVIGDVTAGDGDAAPDTSGWIEILRGETVLASMPVSPGAGLSDGRFAIEIGESHRDRLDRL